MVSKVFVLCKVRHNVSLSPCHAMEPRVGIEQHLTEQIMRYSEALKGVVLSFSNVELARPNGAIVNEMPYIHCKVLADALVFRPKEGMKLRGIVNKIGSNHVGMLFAGVFNGSVAEAELPKGYVHNYAQDCWLGEDGSSISVEDEVEVKVLRVHVAGGMVAIEVTMRFDGAQVVKATATKPKKATHLDLSAVVVATEPMKVAEPVQEKANKSKHLNLATEEVAVEVEVSANPVKKAKKTKHLDLSAEELEVAAEPVKAKKEKKTKKGKHLNLAAEEPEVTAELVKANKEKPATKPTKEKKAKKSKKVEEEVEQVETKKSKKRKQPAQEEAVQEEVAEVKPKKHKDKDAKKKKLKKSKHD